MLALEYNQIQRWGPLQQFTYTQQLKCSENSVQIDKTGAKLQHKKTDCPQWTQK